MKGLLPLLLAFVLSACGTDTYTIAAHGKLDGGTISLTNVTGKIEAFPPASGEPKDEYTVSAASKRALMQTKMSLDANSKTLALCPIACPPPPDAPSVSYLVRIPQGVHAEFTLATGDIDVSDVNAPVDARATNGDIKIQIPSYANASTRTGNVSVTFGDANWPGTLHFSTQRGDVVLYVPALAHARVDLHTDHGTIFTDFDLRGTSLGTAEKIVGDIGGGGNRTLEVRVGSGNIRVLKLVPQM